VYQPGGRCSGGSGARPSTPLHSIDDLLHRWIEAEGCGDVAALDALLDGEFRGDGPRGNVLTKPEWLDRHRTGDLVVEALGWEQTRVRLHGDTAVVTGVLEQSARFRGEDCSGKVLGTVVAVRRESRWSIVNVQLSQR
jgi:hypothetical protein